MFTLLLPPVFFAIFGLQSAYRSQDYGAGNVTAYVMVSMAVYGAMIATTSGGAMVATERAQGWSRQLRLTPLHPAAYVAVKVAVAMTLGLASVATVFVVGALTSPSRRPAWLGCFLLAWLPSAVFAAFGLFMGYLLPSENVMQLLGPLLALRAFAGEIASARTALSAAGIRADLPETVDVSALRGQVFGWVLREAVTNVVRHSGAASCVVRVSPDRIEISDDGTGFTVRPTAPVPGLRGLAERVAGAGGSLHVGTSPSGGVRVVGGGDRTIAAPVGRHGTQPPVRGDREDRHVDPGGGGARGGTAGLAVSPDVSEEPAVSEHARRVVDPTASAGRLDG